MIDFSLAWKAKLPFIGVSSDDPIHVREVLARLTGRAKESDVQLLPSAKQQQLYSGFTYFVNTLEQVTVEQYTRLQGSGCSCVVVNAGPSVMVMDVGILPTPTSFYTDYLQSIAKPEAQPALVAVLQGLSPKVSQEVCQLTMARTGALTQKEIRKTRQMLGASLPGLIPLDTDYDFYEWPKELEEWVWFNSPYFLDPKVPDKLVPRGLLLDGEPGVGKTMAAMVLAKQWDVPLFDLNVPMSIDKFQGVSEARLSRNLSAIDQYAPCVCLMDEVEKLFGSNGHDTGTTQRMLSQLLWWLQYHKSRVFTVMTTNDKSKLPPELYRSLRIDKAIVIKKMLISQARKFSEKVFESVLGAAPSAKQAKVLRDRMDMTETAQWSPADVRVLVYDTIKELKWLTVE